MAQQSSIEQLIQEIKRRVQIIQSEPQTMARELMIDNLSINLENYVEIHKEEIKDAYHINPLDTKWGNIGIEYYNQTYNQNK